MTSLASDQLFHVLKVYPPWGEAMNETSDNLLALGYRIVYRVLGSCLAAIFAPHSPWRNVWIGAGISFVLGSLGAVAAVNANLGPIWFPVALVLTTFPCAWLGGWMCQHRRRRL